MKFIINNIQNRISLNEKFITKIFNCIGKYKNTFLSPPALLRKAKRLSATSSLDERLRKSPMTGDKKHRRRRFSCKINKHFISLDKDNLIQLKSKPGRVEELNFPKEFIIITFVDDKYIRKLNKRFLDRNYVTDVIAFPMQESFDQYRIEEPKSSKYHLKSIVLGDVVISVDRAKVQAKRFKYSFYEELALLIIHGTLHLLGYDDIKSKDILIMRKKEQEILKTMKFKSKN